MIDPSARLEQPCIVKDAAVGARSVVWEFAKVIRGAAVGEDCSVGGCAVVDAARVGHRCAVGHGAQLHPGSQIGDDVFVGPGAILCNDRWPQPSKEGFRADLFWRGFITVRVKDGASIGAGAVILPGVTIGKRAMVAANATAKCDLPDDYLLRRDGSMVPIKPEWRQVRMIEAR